MISFPNHTIESLFVKVLIECWCLFKSLYPSFDNEYYDSIISKTINCANPKFGFMQFMCLFCGKDSKVVAYSCKSKLCLRCGRVKGEKFSQQIKERLHPDISYRHLILTIPEQVRIIFYRFRQDPKFFGAFMKAGWDCVQDFVSEALGCKVECGCLIVLHFVGRNCGYKPHLHILLMGGGIEKASGNWKVLDKFPYKILHRSWKRHLLEMLRNSDELGEWQDIIKLISQRYDGFVARIEKAALPKDTKPLIRYLSKYLCRPQISNKRIKKFTGSLGFVYT